MKRRDTCGSAEPRKFALVVIKVKTEAVDEIRRAIESAQRSGWPGWFRPSVKRRRWIVIETGCRPGTEIRVLQDEPRENSPVRSRWPQDRVRACEIVPIHGHVPLAFLDWFEAYVRGARQELDMLERCGFELDVSR